MLKAKIPRSSAGKCTWCRVDKFIYMSTFRLIDEFINGGESGKRRIIIIG